MTMPRTVHRREARKRARARAAAYQRRLAAMSPDERQRHDADVERQVAIGRTLVRMALPLLENNLSMADYLIGDTIRVQLPRRYQP